MHPMKVFVISLKRSTERRAAIVERMTQAGVNFEFFDAVDGQEKGFLYSDRADPEMTFKRKGYHLQPGERVPTAARALEAAPDPQGEPQCPPCGALRKKDRSPGPCTRRRPVDQSHTHHSAHAQTHGPGFRRQESSGTRVRQSAALSAHSPAPGPGRFRVPPPRPYKGHSLRADGGCSSGKRHDQNENRRKADHEGSFP